MVKKPNIWFKILILLCALMVLVNTKYLLFLLAFLMFFFCYFQGYSLCMTWKCKTSFNPILHMQVTRCEAGTGKFGTETAGGAWEGGNISGSDIGEVSSVFEVRRSQIRNFFSLFRYRKSANFLSVPVCNFHKILHNSVLKQSFKSSFYSDFLFCTLNLRIICYICREKKFVFTDLRKF